MYDDYIRIFNNVLFTERIIYICVLFIDMKVDILHLLEGARQAQGITVIIDVFRAFTTACYIMRNHPKKLIAVGDIQLAYDYKKKDPTTILVGERNEMRPEGFDFANSPSHVKDVDFSGRTVVHTTSSGTQGIVNALHATEILTGSFVNVQAVIEYIKAKNPAQVSLVCMGYAALYPTDEDTFCAEYIKTVLEGKIYDIANMRNILQKGAGARFFDKEKQSYAPAEDFYLCTELNTFNFILRAKKTEPIEIEKITL